MKKVNNLPLLTVAIPTFNRPDSLEKIITQLSQEKNQLFSILISDDGSSDETMVMVKKYQKKMPNLAYSKNRFNLGFTKNLIKIYELAKTKYIWFLSDDETVLPGAIDKILRVLDKYRPTIALFNHSWIDQYGRKTEYGTNKDMFYTDMMQFDDYHILFKTGFISVVIVKKSIPITILKTSNLKNNAFFQISLSLFLLSNKFRLCEVSSMIVRRNPCYKCGEFFKFLFIDQLDAVNSFNHNFDNKKFLQMMKSKTIKNLQLYLSQKLGLFKAYGSPTKATIKQIIKYYGFFSIFILLFPVIYYLIPTFLLKLLYMFQLFRINGYEQGKQIYIRNLNRAYKNTTETGFVKYR